MWKWCQLTLTASMSCFLVSVIVALALYIRVTGTFEFAGDWSCAVLAADLFLPVESGPDERKAWALFVTRAA